MADPATPLVVPSQQPARWLPWPDEVSPRWPDDLSRWFLPDDEFFVVSFRTFLLLSHLIPSLERLFSEQGKDWTVGSEQDFSLLEDDLRVGVRPDVYVLPCPLQDHSFDRFHAYRTDTPVPLFVVEVVSASNWSKDYEHAPGKYAMLGVEELLLCDPLVLEGKSPAPEPYLLQLYRKVSGGKLKRMYAGEGPVWSESVGAWFRVEGELLKVSRDREGKSRVLSYKEGEEEAESKAEAERVSRESAEEQRLAAEEQRLAAQERERSAQEQRRLAEEQRLAAEEQRRLAEERERSAQERERFAQEQRRLAEEQRRLAEEQRRLAEEQRLAAEERERSAEEQRRAADEQRRLAEERERAAEERERSAEEQRRLAEAQAMADAREALVDLCDALAIDLTPERQAHLASLDLPALRSLRARLKQARRWPD
jgi:Uma2 family endonuclease